MPPEYMERTIRDMTPGESGWTVPWAITVDIDRTMWVNGAYSIERESVGTARTRIERTSNGVAVWRDGLGKYTPSDVWPYMGSDPRRDRIPVVELKGVA